MGKTSIDTGRWPCFPCRMVVSPVEITGALPHSVSPTESMAEPGSRPVALQTIPKEATDVKFSVSTVGRALGEQ